MMMARATTSGPGLHRLLYAMTDLAGVQDIPVSGLATDSRAVKPGYLFLARTFRDVSAVPYIDAAIRAGAVAVVVEEGRIDSPGDYTVPVLTVPDLQARTGVIADRFYAHPSADMTVIGVTGTNGKSTTCHMLAQALDGLHGRSCGVIGTLGYGSLGALQAGLHTTPEPVLLQHLLATMRDEQKQQAVIEVSSHGIDQHRVAGVQFAAALFTNLSRDHLDYHGDMRSYAEVKRRLFTDYDIERAIINADDAVGREILRQSANRYKAAYTLNNDLTTTDIGNTDLVTGVIRENVPGQMLIDITSPWGEGRLKTRFAGRFNGYNLLASLSALCALGHPLQVVLDQLAKATPVSGRMELFGGGEQPVVYVDYAHTPDALEQVLRTIRQQCEGQLICVFGCGGDRDKNKRPMMGAVAASHADRIILTNDNPRNEDPGVIIDAIQSGTGEHNHVLREPDREQAISIAIGMAASRDIVLIAGKGHEAYQESAGVRRPFSDQAVVRHTLGKMT